uniref:Protein SMG7-like n=1 Tax=Rhizophora mucronata TaxID=61149 RepID=A0A2P2IMZ3_RHIMU
MRENYEAIILEDHAFAEQHEVEFALWQLHYRRIEEFRVHLNASLSSTGSSASQNGNISTNPDRISKIRSQFKFFLSEATGYYHDLMLKIKSKHGLPLDFFSNDLEGQIIMFKDENKSSEMKKGLIACHRCLIYLGDLSRYKGLYSDGDSKTRDFAAASSYYMQASSLWPSSGNPHHQLAILASYSGDELVAIYRYFRSLAVDSPFTTARENLIIAFERNRQSFSQMLEDAKVLPVKTKTARINGRGRGKRGSISSLKANKIDDGNVKKNKSSVSEILKAFHVRFIRLNGILFSRTSLETFEEVFSMVTGDLLVLLSCGSEKKYNFGLCAADSGLTIVRLVSILIYTVHNVNRETENQSSAEMLQRSVLLQNAFTAIFDFMGLIVERCTQLSDLLSSFLLPGVLIFLEWLACHPDFAFGKEIGEKQAAARSLFWKNCIYFLNKLLSGGLVPTNVDEDDTCFSSMSRYDEGETANRVALWEDFELRGFLPLAPAQLVLDFSKKRSAIDDSDQARKARLQRIIAAGKAIMSVVQAEQQGVCFDSKLNKFVFGIKRKKPYDYGLATFEMPASNSLRDKCPTEKTLVLGNLQPKTQSYAEGEEEDELIVFKPPVNDKNANNPELSYEVLGQGANASQDDLGSCMTSIPAPLGGNASDRSSVCPTSPVTVVCQHLPSSVPATSKWLLGTEACVVNGLNNLTFLDNGLVMKPSLQEHLGISQPPAHSISPPHSLNFSANNQHSLLVSDTAIPSKVDSIISSACDFDSLSVNAPSSLPPNSRMVPVSRPVQRFGPPPGFSTVSSKLLDEPISSITLENEDWHMDDYSWLDGYQKLSSAKATAFTNSINHSAKLYYYAKGNNSLTGRANFPFPGKQLQKFQTESQKGWQGAQISGHVKLFWEKQQQQLRKLNQQSVPLPEPWEGHFFV